MFGKLIHHVNYLLFTTCINSLSVGRMQLREPQRCETSHGGYGLVL